MEGGAQKWDKIKRMDYLWNHDRTPRRLGSLYCLKYDKNDKPKIVIGPDYWFSLLELILVNTIALSLAIFPAFYQIEIKLGSALVLVLGFQNYCFLKTATGNHGLPPRNPAEHS